MRAYGVGTYAVSQYTNDIRAGRSLVGCCPIHYMHPASEGEEIELEEISKMLDLTLEHNVGPGGRNDFNWLTTLLG
jgi:hypothetical protein